MSDVADEALAYLASHHVLTLATSGPDGVWGAAVFYVNIGFTLIFLSSPNSRHARDVAAQPRAAITVQENYDQWVDIRGVQAEGMVRRLEGASEIEARQLYTTRFSFLASPPAAIASALERVGWYRFTPERLYFINNSRGFGHRDQIALPDQGRLD